MINSSTKRRSAARRASKCPPLPPPSLSREPVHTVRHGHCDRAWVDPSKSAAVPTHMSEWIEPLLRAISPRNQSEPPPADFGLLSSSSSARRLRRFRKSSAVSVGALRSKRKPYEAYRWHFCHPRQPGFGSNREQQFIRQCYTCQQCRTSQIQPLALWPEPNRARAQCWRSAARCRGVPLGWLRCSRSTLTSRAFITVLRL